MPQIADLKAKVSIDGASQAKKDLAELKGGGGASGGGILGLADSFKTGLGAVTGFLTGFVGFKLAGDAVGFLADQFKDVLDQASSQQAVMAQTAAVIKSTGGAAGVTADQVGDLADKYARLTGVSDDTIQSAENILLTFTDIKSNVFPQVTQLVLDMSQAFHQDLKSSAIEVGKAMQDPIQGATALRRVGVQLSDSQMELIKHFVATGDKAKAQAIIMKELTRETGGSAEAYGTTFPGMVDRFNVSLDQAKEKIGLAILPILQDMLTKYVMPLADWIGQHLPAAIQVLTTFMNTILVPAINNIINSPFVTTLEGWANEITNNLLPTMGEKGLKGGAEKAAGALGSKGFAGAANSAKGSLYNLSSQMGTTGGDIGDSKSGFIGHVNAGTTSVLGLADAIDPNTGDKGRALVPAMRRADEELDTFSSKQKKNQEEIPAWQRALGGAAGSWDGLNQHINEAGKALSGFKQSVDSNFAAATKTEIALAQGMSGHLSDFGANLKGIWEGIWGALSAPVQIGLHTVEGIVNLGMDILAGKPEKLRQDWLNSFKKILGDLQQFADSVHRLISSLPSWVTGGAGGLPPWLQGLGGGTRRASGGPVSGPFIGAEGDGPELLLTPGYYNARPGSYVMNASQTRQILAGGGMARGMGRGDTYVTVYGADHNSALDIARTVTRQLDWKAALHA